MSGDVHVRFRERLGVRFPRATRLVIGVERRDDAERVRDVLPKRLGRYGLTLHADKTRVLPFGRPPRRQQGGKGPASFDFLGFTLHWRRARSGRWGMWCKTRSSRLQRAITVAAAWCRRHRHLPVAVQHAALTRRIQGHFNYFGVSGNARSLGLLVNATERHWYVASPSKQPHASHLAEVRCVVGTIPSARASDSRANLGRIAMSHISGRAGWWKPPSPVLVRASGEQSSGATRQSAVKSRGT